MEFFFPGVQQMFCRAVTGDDTHPRFRFISDEPHFEIEDGIQFHHGHQFEVIHAMDFRSSSSPAGSASRFSTCPGAASSCSRSSTG